MRFNYVMLGYILREKRVEKGLSKNKLAQLVGISQPEVTRIENGIRTVPNIITLINMCEILDIDFINLLKVTGFVDRKNLLEKGFYDMKIYKVTAKKTKEIELEVEAEDEENAMEIVQDFIDSVDVFNVKIPNLVKDYFEISAEETDEKLEENSDNFEEISEENDCKNCEFFCSECGRCTLEH